MVARIGKQQAARDQAMRKAEQEEQARRAVAEREAQEAQMEKLSRERLEAERKAQTSLDARIETERKLALQLQARMEREKRADELAEQNASREERLRQAAMERKAQERRLQAERLAARNAARAVAASASPVAAIYAKYFDFPKRYYWIAAVLLVAGAAYYAWHSARVKAPADGLERDRIFMLQTEGTPSADALPLKLSLELGAAGGPVPAARPMTPDEEKAAEQEKAWAFRAGAVREQLKVGAYADIVRSAPALTHDFPGRWEGWFWLGSAQSALGRTAAAEVSLERAAKLNPGEPQIWMQRATLARERNDHAAAIRLLAEARALSPNMPQIYLNLGYSNDALGQFAEAEKNYRTFLSLTEGDAAYAPQRQSVGDRLGNGKR